MNTKALLEQYEDWKAEKKYPTQSLLEQFVEHLEIQWDLKRAEATRRMIEAFEDGDDLGAVYDNAYYLLSAPRDDIEVLAWLAEDDDDEIHHQVTRSAGGTPLSIVEEDLQEILGGEIY